MTRRALILFAGIGGFCQNMFEPELAACIFDAIYQKDVE
jgi:hypothetical protein